MFGRIGISFHEKRLLARAHFLKESFGVISIIIVFNAIKDDLFLQNAGINPLNLVKIKHILMLSILKMERKKEKLL